MGKIIEEIAVSRGHTIIAKSNSANPIDRVDFSEADKNPEKKDYFFGTVNYNRVEFSTGRDLDLHNYNKHVNFFIYPLVEGTSFTKSFSYRNI